MHADEQHTDVALVRRLLATQFPEWASLPIARVASSGTDNALYRLGDELVARLPRIGWAVGGVEKAHEWLPRLAPLLPVTISVPIARGEPGEGYPWRWSVYPWLRGESPVAGASSDWLVAETARFVRALRAIHVDGGPSAGRGGPLARGDEGTRTALAQLDGMIDTGAAASAWEDALRAPPWTGPPVWTHGDLMPSNLLVEDGRLAAVIDCAGVGVGDPACDLMLAWNMFGAAGREAFRRAVEVDDATWARGRGWALTTALVALPYYKDTNPGLADNARYRIREILSERV